MAWIIVDIGERAWCQGRAGHHAIVRQLRNTSRQSPVSDRVTISSPPLRRRSGPRSAACITPRGKEAHDAARLGEADERRSPTKR